MHSLMIVEDELLARLALKNSIPWEKYNIDEILEAQDGLEALEKYRKYRPDILIVDINIPFMNGIELIQEIRKEDTRIKIIILSCLEDFRYAQEAIRANVSRYILKASMSLDEIEAAVAGAVQEIREKNTGPLFRRQRSADEEYKTKSVCFRKLCSGAEAEEDGNFPITLPACIAVFKVDFDFNREGDLSSELVNKMNFVKNIITTTVREQFPCCVVILPGELYTVLIECKDKWKTGIEEELLSVLKGAAGLIAKYTSSQVSAGVSSPVLKHSDFVKGFAEAKRRLASECFCETGLTFLGENEIVSGLSGLYVEYEQEIGKRLESLGLLGAVENMKDWPEFSEDYLREMQNYWRILLDRTGALAGSRTPDGQPVIRALADYARKLYSIKKLGEGREIYLAFLDEVERSRSNTGKHSRTVEKAMSYTKKNYTRPITLSDAAEAVHVSVSYLSMIFTKEYGSNYTEYLTELRISRAKVFLEAGNDSISDIAGKCGFNDHAYFTRTFKKVTGMSPGDYRKRVKDNLI